MTIKPSGDFLSYAESIVAEVERSSNPSPTEDVARELWAAASYDAFLRTGLRRRLLGNDNAPTQHARDYERVIGIARTRIIHKH